MLKLFVCTVLCLLTSDVKAADESEEGPKYDYELPCLSFGGLCVQIDDCPEDKRAELKGLCPLRQKRGVECCYSLPISETRCRRRGGECVPKYQQCPETSREATDCADDEKCCILLN